MMEASSMESLHKVKAIVAVGDDGFCHVLRADHYLKLALQEVPFPVLKVKTGAGIYRWEGTVSNGKILGDGKFFPKVLFQFFTLVKSVVAVVR